MAGFALRCLLCDDSVGGGRRVCLHNPRGAGHRLPDARSQRPRIQVESHSTYTESLFSVYYVNVQQLLCEEPQVKLGLVSAACLGP